MTCSNEKWSSATCASTKLRKNHLNQESTVWYTKRSGTKLSCDDSWHTGRAVYIRTVCGNAFIKRIITSNLRVSGHIQASIFIRNCDERFVRYSLISYICRGEVGDYLEIICTFVGERSGIDGEISCHRDYGQPSADSFGEPCVCQGGGKLQSDIHCP